MPKGLATFKFYQLQGRNHQVFWDPIHRLFLHHYKDPGPLGIWPTSPKAEALYLMAILASSLLLIQQILFLGLVEKFMNIKANVFID